LAGLTALWKLFPFYAQEYSLTDVIVLSALLSLFGQLGDLVESIIKRSLSAKDSGSFFPGHGGVFDRIDSLLFNAPILFYYLILFKK
jgi:phosphatidate cytidylyltransferase